MAIVWKPMGEVGEFISKAAALQHASARCRRLMHLNKQKVEAYLLTATYALMVVGLELRRLAPHAEVVRAKRVAGPTERDSLHHGRINGSDVWEGVAANGLCTTPHVIDGFGNTGFGIPVDTGYADVGGRTLVTMEVLSEDDKSWRETDNRQHWSVFTDGDFQDNYDGVTQKLNDLGKNDHPIGLPDIFVGPPANYDARVDYWSEEYSTGPIAFPIFQIRSTLRNVLDNGHKNLLPQEETGACAKQLERSRMHAIVRYALLHAHALHEEVCSDEVGDATAQATLLQASTTQKDDRSGIWNDMLREVSISNDRLYTFVRTLSGTMGEDASVLLSSVDETAQRAARAMEAERKEIAKRVSDFQTKIVEVIIGGIVKTSHLEMRPHGPDGEFQVVDAEMAKELRALASGESGRPFFEANVAVQGMINQARTDQTSLGAVVRGLGGVVSTLYDQLQTELSTATGSGSGGLSMLAQPRNSFMVHLRDDATAAIRVAYDRFSCEFRGRAIKLYELVEGCDSHLSLRFAEFVAHVLIQIRSSSGPTALYVSEATRKQTALQARAALIRLTNRASEYTRFAPTPSFHSTSAEGIQAARLAYFGSVVPGHGGTSSSSQKGGLVLRVEGRSDTRGGWQGGYSLPYTAGLRYHPYPQPRQPSVPPRGE